MHSIHLSYLLEMKASVVERIKAYNSDREPEVVAQKWATMAQDPFRFFRGTCHLFYEDLLPQYPLPASPLVWSCGDTHLENFGSYKGWHKLVFFDLNDFDEGVLAPALYDLSRLITSVYVATSVAGYSQKEGDEWVKVLLDTYQHVLRHGKAGYIERETSKGVIKKLIKQVSKRTDRDFIKERAKKEGKKLRLRVGEKLLSIPEKKKKVLVAYFKEWLKEQELPYKIVDAGFRIAGTGSIGVNRYVFLLKNKEDRYLFLDVKQALPSSLLKGITTPQPKWENEAQRIISVQDMMQQSTPTLLRSFAFENTHYVVKEMQPTADKIDMVELMKRPKLIAPFLKQLALLVASAQLRSSGRRGSSIGDELIAFAENAEWEKELTAWCKSYSKQVQGDYALFIKSLKREK